MKGEGNTSILDGDVAVAQVEAIASPLLASAGVPSWWDPLFKSCPNRSIFTSSAWIQTWLEVYGERLAGQWIRWEHNGAVVGGCLLVSRVTWKWLVPMRSLFLNATGEVARRAPMPEYNDILSLLGFEEVVATDAIRVVQAMHWSRFHVLGYQEGALVSRLVSRLPTAATETDESKANYVDLTALTGVEFEASLAGAAGNQIRRNRRLHEKALGKLEVAKARNLDEAMRYFSELANLHNARWRKKGQGGSFSSEVMVEFHRRLIRRLWPLGGVDLISVHTSGKVIGYLYNFTTENKVYFYQSGFAYQQGSKLSPGLLTHALCIEYYRRQGRAEYDFLAGEAQYKRMLAKSDRSLYWTILYRNAPLPRILSRARSLKWRLERLLRGPT